MKKDGFKSKKGSLLTARTITYNNNTKNKNYILMNQKNKQEEGENDSKSRVSRKNL